VYVPGGGSQPLPPLLEPLLDVDPLLDVEPLLDPLPELLDPLPELLLLEPDEDEQAVVDPVAITEPTRRTVPRPTR
jgi:hypothetical protein